MNQKFGRRLPDDSYNRFHVVPTPDLKPGELWLLDLDNQVVLPIEITYLIRGCSTLVSHSLSRLKDRYYPRTSQPNDPTIHAAWPILWSVLQNLQIEL